MINLLEKEFIETYGEQGKPYSIKYVIDSDFELHDDNACLLCRPYFRDCCNHVNFRLHSDTDITLIQIEDFISLFSSLSDKQRCDLLFYDENKLVLADMYCGMSDYIYDHMTNAIPVIGKKNKVLFQIESTLDILFSVPAIEDFVKSKKIKQAIFACRVLDDELFTSAPHKLSSSMGKFLGLQNHMNTRTLVREMKYDFKYVTCRYDNVYNW